MVVAARFDFLQPSTVEEACRILAAHGGNALPIAGGTDLLREIRRGVKRPALVVALDRLTDLCGVRPTPGAGGAAGLEGAGRGLVVGALTTMAELARDELIRAELTALAEAAGQLGSPQVRNRATIGGNLCNARPCADSALPCLVHDAVLVLQSEQGRREVTADGFMTGPGQTVREPDELLAALRFAPLPPCSGSAFLTLTNRKAVEIGIASAAARLTLDGPVDGTIREARIALGSVAPTPIRARSAEALLAGKLPGEELLAEAAATAAADSRPIDDLRGSAGYRRRMVEVLVRRALTTALSRARARGDAA